MRQAIAWVKSMPTTVISVVVMIVSLSALGWVWSRADEFREEVTEPESQLRTIDRLMRQSIPLPAPEPGAERQTLEDITINERTIATLTNLFQQMREEYEQIQSMARDHNRAGREPLIEGVFPEPEGPQHPYQARDSYRVVFPQLLQPPGQRTEDRSQAEEDETAEAVQEAVATLPTLTAGLPPTAGELSNELDQFSEEYHESVRAESRDQRDAELTPEEIHALNEEKRNRLKDSLYRRAQQIDVYAQTDPNAQDYPLHFHELRQASRPQSYQIWEAQLGLWIQQDIIRAIREANEVDEPGASVLTGPVKRLLELEVWPGYVGLHTRGAVDGRDRPNEPYRQPEGYSEPPSDEVPRDFAVGPTGHVSNPVYDVRHVRLLAIVDYHRLPELYHAIHSTNFMTVIQTELEDVDKYAHYREGFVYGEGVDAVRAEIIIESLWLRDWTEDFMPDRVRAYLGILPPIDDEADDPFYEDDWGAPGDPFGDPGAGPGF